MVLRSLNLSTYTKGIVLEDAFEFPSKLTSAEKRASLALRQSQFTFDQNVSRGEVRLVSEKITNAEK